MVITYEYCMDITLERLFRLLNIHLQYVTKYLKPTMLRLSVQMAQIKSHALYDTLVIRQ